MKDVILFSIPKPFIGHIGTIQCNAFASWSLLPNTQVVILGNEVGTVAASQRFGFQLISEIACNQHGTPYLDFAFQHIASLFSPSSILIFVNADIILLPTIIRAIEQISFHDFLLAARRYNLNVDTLQSPSLEAFSLLELSARIRGDVVPAFSSDVFVLPASSCLIKAMPKLLIGRKGWDNWMMWAARKHHIPLVDGTDFLVTVHQNHDYTHIIRSSDTPTLDTPWSGPESLYQEELIGKHALSLDFATYRFKSNAELEPNYHGFLKLYMALLLRERVTDSFLTRLLFRLLLKPVSWFTDTP